VRAFRVLAGKLEIVSTSCLNNSWVPVPKSEAVAFDVIDRTTGGDDTRYVSLDQSFVAAFDLCVRKALIRSMYLAMSLTNEKSVGTLVFLDELERTGPDARETLLPAIRDKLFRSPFQQWRCGLDQTEAQRDDEPVVCLGKVKSAENRIDLTDEAGEYINRVENLGQFHLDSCASKGGIDSFIVRLSAQCQQKSTSP